METISVRKLTHSNLHIDCDYSIAAELKEFFSFYVPGYRYMPAFKRRVWDGKIRLFDSNSGELPAGLYHHFLRLCKSRDYKVDLVKTRYGLPDDFDKIDPREIYNYSKELNLPWELRDYQFAGISHALKYKRAILLSPTGSGKSLIIYMLCDYLKGRKLIIVPTTSLVFQLDKDFESYYTNNTYSTHLIMAGQDKNADSDIFISTWQSIYKQPKKWFDQFDVVIGDEAHLFKANSLTKIMTKLEDCDYRYGFTGTLDGTQTHRLVLEGLFGPVMKATSTKELIDTDRIADLRIKALVLKYPENVRKMMAKQKYDIEMKFIASWEPRNNFIKNLAISRKGNTLLLFQFVEKHGRVLYDMINSACIKHMKAFWILIITPR